MQTISESYKQRTLSLGSEDNRAVYVTVATMSCVLIFNESIAMYA